MELFEALVLGWSFGGFFVELQNINHGLGVLSSFLLGNAALVNQPLPFLRQTLDDVNNVRWSRVRRAETDRELTSRAIVADVGDMNGILRR